MIPKIIHYFWFGNDHKPDIVVKCFKSWKMLATGYEIIEWNEQNFDVNCCDYTAQAYKAKKYAFVTDAARFMILYKYGGIYLDTDVELLKPLDPLLTHQMFMGFEDDCSIAPGLIIGAAPHDEIIHELGHKYEHRLFVKEDGCLDETTVCEITSAYLNKIGFQLNGNKQSIQDRVLYSREYFCPLDFKTGKEAITSNTFTFHHYAATWHDDIYRIKLMHIRKLSRYLGYEKSYILVNAIFTLKYDGANIFFKKIVRKLKGHD